MGTSIYEHIFFGKIIVPGAILFATIVLYRGFREFSDFILEKAQRDETGYRVKLQTFLPILSVTFYAVLCITSALLIMANLEINIIPILATSTVFSAVVGFAAQDTIKSFLKGIMLLIEENLYVGAYVKVGNMEGLVERLSVRALYMRGVDGSLYVIPYAVIDTITNYSKDYSYYYDELYFDAKDEIEKISSILVEVIENMRKEKYYQDKILSGVEIYGMKPFDLTGQKIFWRIKTSPDVYGKIVKYEIYRRLYYEYKKHNINVPVANSTVNVIS
jgi:small-conductance mechanosensitive channel